jgi:hypothetical protein
MVLCCYLNNIYRKQKEIEGNLENAVQKLPINYVSCHFTVRHFDYESPELTEQD